jgi:hypothetical protein
MKSTESAHRCRCDECQDRYEILQELYSLHPFDKAVEKESDAITKEQVFVGMSMQFILSKEFLKL